MYGMISGGLTRQHAVTSVVGKVKGVVDVALKLKPNVLSGSGVFYKFRLTVTDIGGVKASAVQEIKINGAPSPGEKLLERSMVRMVGGDQFDQ